MSMMYSLDEVLAMAEQIERNGARFYRAAAQKTTDPQVADVLEHLAAWEDGHERTFVKMRAELTGDELSRSAFDPEGEGETYLRAVADQQVFKLGSDAALAGADTASAILKVALKFESDSILFFLGMRDVVPGHLGRDEIQRLIDEEVTHVAYIGKQLAALAGEG